MRQMIDHVDHRALLAIGLVITAGALELMSHVSPDGGELWLAATSAAQGVGVGLLFTPLSTLAFSTLGPELRTDAAGVYNLARQLGCAAGVATMTAVLQARIRERLERAQPTGRYRRHLADARLRDGCLRGLHRLLPNLGDRRHGDDPRDYFCSG